LYYATKIEVNNKCFTINNGTNTPVNPNDFPTSIDSNRSFQTLLWLYAWSTIIDALREFFGVLLYKFDTVFLAAPICHLKLNVFVQFAAMIMNHVYRLEHGGQVCSGDYLGDKSTMTAEQHFLYATDRGHLLWVLLIIYWIVLGLLCCGCCVATITFGWLAVTYKKGR